MHGLSLSSDVAQLVAIGAFSANRWMSIARTTFCGNNVQRHMLLPGKGAARNKGSIRE